MTQAVTIDGSTQPDWTGAPLITKKARTVPEPVRTELGSLITAAQADVTIVKTGLACP